MSSQTTPLTSVRASWYQVDISAAGWPLLSPDTYYWVVVTPCSPLTMTTQNNNVYNGAVWVGFDDRLNSLTSVDAGDNGVFRGRQYLSERFPGDSTYGANTPAAVIRNRDLLSWGTQTGNPQYTNWAAAPYNSTVRYGVQLLGWQVYPPASLSGVWGWGAPAYALTLTLLLRLFLLLSLAHSCPWRVR